MESHAWHLIVNLIFWWLLEAPASRLFLCNYKFQDFRKKMESFKIGWAETIRFYLTWESHILHMNTIEYTTISKRRIKLIPEFRVDIFGEAMRTKKNFNNVLQTINLKNDDDLQKSIEQTIIRIFITSTKESHTIFLYNGKVSDIINSHVGLHYWDQDITHYGES